MGRNVFLPEVDEQERYRLWTAANFERKQEQLAASSSSRCAACNFPREGGCICERVETIHESDFPHRIVVLTHVREIDRASNTGRLVGLVLRDGCEVLCEGVAEHEERLDVLCEGYRGRSLVLYPAADAVSPETFAAEQEREVCSSSVLVIVLDGTWGQARRLNKRVDSTIPRVALPNLVDNTETESQNTNGANRINTVQALSMLLQTFHAPAAAALSNAFDLFQSARSTLSAREKQVVVHGKGPVGSKPKHNKSWKRQQNLNG